MILGYIHYREGREPASSAVFVAGEPMVASTDSIATGPGAAVQAVEPGLAWAGFEPVFAERSTADGTESSAADSGKEIVTHQHQEA
jgi:hypothetical protein